MKNILITVGILFALCGFSAAQSSGANIGGVNFGTGANTPAACVAPSYFTNTTTKVYSVCGAGGTYIAIGTSGTFAPAASPTFTGNVTVPNGTACTAGAMGIVFTNTSQGFWYDSGNGVLALCVGAGKPFGVTTGGAQLISSGILGFSSGAVGGAYDTGFSRGAAGVMDCGTGAAASTACTMKNAADIRVGTTFTSNAGCSETTLTGGATAGKFTSVSTACTVIVTMGNGATAPNGWACSGYDITTPATGTFKEVATAATTASFTLAVTASDVVVFQCVGF